NTPYCTEFDYLKIIIKLKNVLWINKISFYNFEFYYISI
ncbi:unnamed protein product, partial [marine sediment metagenome]